MILSAKLWWKFPTESFSISSMTDRSLAMALSMRVWVFQTRRLFAKLVEIT